MKELDIVRLKASFRGLPARTKGAIVHEYDGNFYEVEFVDSDGTTVGVLTTPADLLELTEERCSTRFCTNGASVTVILTTLTAHLNKP